MSGAADTVSLRVTLRYATVDEFVDRHAEHVSSAGLFVRTKAPKSPGTRVRFQLLLPDGSTALQGEGVVVSVRDDNRPGMALRFNELDETSRRIVDRIVEMHGDGALAPTPLSLRLGASSPELPAFGGGSFGTGSLSGSGIGSGSFGSGGSSFSLSSAAWPSADIGTSSGPGPDPTERLDLSQLRSSPPSTPILPPTSKPPKEPMDDGPSASLGVHSDDPLPPPPRIPEGLRGAAPAEPPTVPGPTTLRSHAPPVLESEADPGTDEASALEHADTDLPSSATEVDTPAPTVAVEAYKAALQPASDEPTPAEGVHPPPEALQDGSAEPAGTEARSEVEAAPPPRPVEQETPTEGETDRLRTPADGASGPAREASGLVDPNDLEASGLEDPDDREASSLEDTDDREASGLEDTDDRDASGLEVPDDREASGLEDPDDGEASGSEAMDEASASDGRESVPEAGSVAEGDATSDMVSDPGFEAPVQAPSETDDAARETREADATSEEASEDVGQDEALADEPEGAHTSTTSGADIDIDATPEAPGAAEPVAVGDGVGADAGSEPALGEAPLPLEAESEIEVEDPSETEPIDGVDAEDVDPIAARTEGEATGSVSSFDPPTPESALPAFPGGGAETDAKPEPGSRLRVEAEPDIPIEPADEGDFRAKPESDLEPEPADGGEAPITGTQPGEPPETASPPPAQRPASSPDVTPLLEIQPALSDLTGPAGMPDADRDSQASTEVAAAPEFSQEALTDAGDDTDALAVRDFDADPHTPIDDTDAERMSAGPMPDLQVSEGFAPSTDIVTRDTPPLMANGEPEAEVEASEPGVRAGGSAALPIDLPAAEDDDMELEDETSAEGRSLPPSRPREVTEVGPPPVVHHRPPSGSGASEQVPATAMNLPPPTDAAPEMSRDRGRITGRRAHAEHRPDSGVRVEGLPGLDEAPMEEDTAPHRIPMERSKPGKPRRVVERDRSTHDLPIQSPPSATEASSPLSGEAKPLNSSAPAVAAGSGDLPPGTAVAVGVEFGVRWIRAGRFERKEFKPFAPTGGLPLPGYVAVRHDGQLHTGPRAKELAENAPDRSVSVMELLLSVQDGRITRPELPLMGWGPEGGLVQLGEYRFEIYEVVQALVGGVKSLIERSLGGAEYRVFLGLPPGLDPLAASLVRTACKEAGLPVAHMPGLADAHVAAFHLEDEPVDTALIVMIDDLHTGLSIVKRGPQGLRTVYERRFDDVSARAIDDAVVDLTLRSLLQQAGEDHREDKAASVRVREAFALARQDLRRTPTVELKVSLPAPGGASNVTLDRTIQLARSRIYGLGEGLANLLYSHVTSALADSGIDPKSVGMVLLSGEGASYPPFGQMLAQLTGREPSMMMPAMIATAQGLARFGRAYEQRTVAKRPDTLDASVGIELPGQRFRPLIPGGTKLPVELRRSQPMREGQTELELRLLQGEGETTRTCQALGAMGLRGLPDGKSVRVELVLRIDADGVLTVVMSEPTSEALVQQSFATQQTPDDRRRALPPPRSVAGSAPPAKGGPGLLGRLFGRR